MVIVMVVVLQHTLHGSHRPQGSVASLTLSRTSRGSSRPECPVIVDPGSGRPVVPLRLLVMVLLLVVMVTNSVASGSRAVVIIVGWLRLLRVMVSCCTASTNYRVTRGISVAQGYRVEPVLVVMLVMPMHCCWMLTNVFTVITVTGMLLLLVCLTSNRTNHYDHP